MTCVWTALDTLLGSSWHALDSSWHALDSSRHVSDSSLELDNSSRAIKYLAPCSRSAWKCNSASRTPTYILMCSLALVCRINAKGVWRLTNALQSSIDALRSRGAVYTSATTLYLCQRLVHHFAHISQLLAWRALSIDHHLNRGRQDRLVSHVVSHATVCRGSRVIVLYSKSQLLSLLVPLYSVRSARSVLRMRLLRLSGPKHRRVRSYEASKKPKAQCTLL